jgi:hypothetical protein
VLILHIHKGYFHGHDSCDVLPTSAEATGCTLNAMTATIVTVSMANASGTSSATTAVAAMTSATTRRVASSARTKASKSVAYMASMAITCTTIAALIRATKHAPSCMQTMTTTFKQQQKTKPL